MGLPVKSAEMQEYMTTRFLVVDEAYMPQKDAL
jgi:hypothetical protein